MYFARAYLEATNFAVRYNALVNPRPGAAGRGAPDFLGYAPPADPASAEHLNLGRAPTIFGGSNAPGAGCPCPTGMAPPP